MRRSAAGGAARSREAAAGRLGLREAALWHGMARAYMWQRPTHYCFVALVTAALALWLLPFVAWAECATRCSCARACGLCTTTAPTPLPTTMQPPACMDFVAQCAQWAVLAPALSLVAVGPPCICPLRMGPTLNYSIPTGPKP
jgi:hypothetical protein